MAMHTGWSCPKQNVGMIDVQGWSGSVPVVLQSNFSYGYKPNGLDSQFVLSLAPQDGGFFNRVQQIGGKLLSNILFWISKSSV